jgi:riboflavin biosynthesis pyrimidine reductase
MDNPVTNRGVLETLHTLENSVQTAYTTLVTKMGTQATAPGPYELEVTALKAAIDALAVGINAAVVVNPTLNPKQFPESKPLLQSPFGVPSQHYADSNPVGYTSNPVIVNTNK